MTPLPGILGALSLLFGLPTGEAAPDGDLTSRFSVLFLRAPGARAILTPASSFVMGSTPAEVVDAFVECQKEQRGPECDPQAFANEGPVRTVALSAYYLDRTEVTVGAYQRCVELGKC